MGPRLVLQAQLLNGCYRLQLCSPGAALGLFVV